VFRFLPTNCHKDFAKMLSGYRELLEQKKRCEQFMELNENDFLNEMEKSWFCNRRFVEFKIVQITADEIARIYKYLENSGASS